MFLTALLESLAVAGLFIPGVALLFALALLAAQTGTSLALLIGAGIFGAIIGDLLSFYAGHYYGERILRTWPMRRYPGLVEKGRSFFCQHGGKSVLIGRFVGPVRPVVPLMAGCMGMSTRRFLLFNVGSALVWGPVYILPGFLAGQAIHAPSLTIQSPWMLTSSIILLSMLVGLLVSEAHWYRTRLPMHWPRSAVLVTTAGFLGFVFWTLLHLNTDVGAQADLSLRAVLAENRHPARDLFILLNNLGDPLFLYPFFGLFLILLLRNGHKRMALGFLIGGALIPALVMAGRQEFSLGTAAQGLSPDDGYPDLHTAGTILVYGLVSVTALARQSSLTHRLAGLVCASSILLVTLSRLYRNSFETSEVVGGLLLGMGAAGLACWVATGRTSLSCRFWLSTPQLVLLAVAWLTWGTSYHFLHSLDLAHHQLSPPSY